MLSLAVLKGANSGAMAEYYTKEFTAGTGEMTVSQEAAAERSRWWGDGVEDLGLDGPVDEASLQSLLHGRNPKTGQVLFDPTAAQLLAIARNLEIDRTLGREDIEYLRQGLNPETKEPLGIVMARYTENLFNGRKGLDRSVSALDMTLSAPKSVSLMVAVGDEDVRAAAEAAHERAVDAAMTFVQEELVAVRRGHDGVAQEKGTGIAAALVTQLASRNHDPQLHTHCVLSSAARGSDGRVSALNASMMHSASKVIGSVYQAELRHQLTKSLGVAWEVRPDGLGEITDISRSTLREFSTRAAQIDESIDRQQLEDERILRDVELRLDLYERAEMRVRTDPDNASAEDRERAKKLELYHKVLRSSFKDGKFNASRKRLLVQLTRPSKDEPAEEELRAQWMERWEASGESWESVLERSRTERMSQEADRVRTEDNVKVFREALAAELTGQNATFGRREALTTAMRIADQAMTAEEIVAETDRFLASHAIEVRPDRAQYANWSLGGGARYTTAAVLEQERELKQVAAVMLDRTDSAVCDLSLAAAKANEYTLNEEQEGLLTSMVVTGQQLVMARGIAGSGKTHVLGAAASVLRSEGYQVVGLATAAATAQRLSSESGFDRSSSIDRFLTLAAGGRWERGTSAGLLQEREALQGEKRSMEQQFTALIAEAGDDIGEVERLEEERANARAAWEVRWNAWLKTAKDELETRERASDSLEARRQTLDAIGEELKHREHVSRMMPADERDLELEAIKQERAELAEARERWTADLAIFREQLSPTEKLPDDNRVVIVVDEAGMVETEHYYRLLKLAAERDWKVAFVGDDRQLQEVNRGGAFRMLTELGGSVELGTARRARAAWELQAQRRWWATEDPDAIKDVAQTYIDHERVTFVTDRVVRTAIATNKVDTEGLDPDDIEREVGRQLMVERFFEDYDRGVDHLLIASRRDDVHALNKAVQTELIKRGVISATGPSAKAADVRSGSIAGWYDLHADDRVLIMQNVSGTAIKNGMTGKVVRINKDGSARLNLPTGPDGEMRGHTLTAKQLSDGYVALGNATTAHKSQGMTTEAATALLDSSNARESAYPAMTRGKHDNHVIWLTEKNNDTPAEQLAKMMAKSSRKRTALESWSHGPTREEIETLRAEMSADGIAMDEDEAAGIVNERRRQDFLKAKEEAESRDYHVERSHQLLSERAAEARAQVAQLSVVRERTL